jgi:hypothetical protein
MAVIDLLLLNQMELNLVYYTHLHLYYGLVRFANFFNPMNSRTFVLFGKYYLIVDQLGSKGSSRNFQLNCVISYFFTYI